MDIAVRASGLRAKREGKAISRCALALAVGVPANRLGTIEAGLPIRDADLRERLMRSLDAEWTELFELTITG